MATHFFKFNLVQPRAGQEKPVWTAVLPPPAANLPAAPRPIDSFLPRPKGPSSPTSISDDTAFAMAQLNDSLTPAEKAHKSLARVIRTDPARISHIGPTATPQVFPFPDQQGQPRNNLFHTETIYRLLTNAGVADQEAPDHHDIRDILYRDLQKNPQQAKALIDLLYKSFPQFNPMKDFFQKVDANSHVEAPKISATDPFWNDPEMKFYRPALRLAPDGKTFQTVYIDTRDPENAAKVILHDDLKKIWLERAKFVDAYNHLVDVDLDDAIRNDYYWKLQRDVTFYLDLMSAGLALLPTFSLSAMLFGEAGSASGVLKEAAANPVLTSILLWFGLSAATKSGPFRDHPVGAATRGIFAAIALVRKFAENDIFVAFRDYLGHDPKNYFHARHLSPTGIASKYLRILFPLYLPIPNFTNVELELWKDFTDTFKWYNRLKGLLDATKSKAKTGGEYAKKLTDLTKSTLTWAPKTKGQWLRAGLHYATNFAVVAGLGTVSGADASLGELALASGIITAISTAMHVYIDQTKEVSPALGILFRRINSFVLSSAALISAGAQQYQVLDYTSALAASFVVIVALGGYLQSHKEQVNRFIVTQAIKSANKA